MLKITEKYYLGSNKNNFVLYERKVSETGNERFKNIGYICTLDALYQTLIEKEIRENLELLNNIEKINEIIIELKDFTISYTAKEKNDVVEKNKEE